MATRKPATKSTRGSSKHASTSNTPRARAKSDDSGAASSKTSARATVSGPARSDAAGRTDATDAHIAKMEGTQALAARMPFNPNKAQEHGKAALTPSEGVANEPSDPSVSGSTLTETNASDKAGAGQPAVGFNPANGPLDRVRVDSGGRALTTNQGVPVARQPELAQGRACAGPTLLEDFILREKITHFDHERIPERIVHARGSGAHGYFECYEPLDRGHARLDVRRGGQAHAGVRALLDGRRRARLDRHGARRARLRRQVLHGRRQLGPGRQQHPGVLHPGRDEVSRSDPRGRSPSRITRCRRRRPRTTRSGISSR